MTDPTARSYHHIDSTPRAQNISAFSIPHFYRDHTRRANGVPRQPDRRTQSLPLGCPARVRRRVLCAIVRERRGWLLRPLVRLQERKPVLLQLHPSF